MIACRTIDGLWRANALPFDIVGIGQTQIESLTQLAELVREYIIDAASEMEKGNVVELFNPADREEWGVSQEICA